MPALVVLGACGAGRRFHQRLDANIRGVPLGDRGGAEHPDAFGHTPVNMLVIGSDARADAADCRLGGGCAHTGVRSGGGNADVELLAHIAADRSNATVLSIPRDTVTELPACRDGATGAAEPDHQDLCLAVAMTLGAPLGPPRRVRAGQTIPYADWHARRRLDTWG